jgi:hypothetical protein
LKSSEGRAQRTQHRTQWKDGLSKGEDLSRVVEDDVKDEDEDEVNILIWIYAKHANKPNRQNEKSENPTDPMTELPVNVMIIDAPP